MLKAKLRFRVGLPGYAMPVSARSPSAGQDAVKVNSRLEILNISNNQIDDQGAIALAEAVDWPVNGTSLRSL